MSRIPYLTEDDLDDAQRELWSRMTGSRGADIVGDNGALIGPFNAFMTAPAIGRRLSGLGGSLRFEMSVDRRLIEVCIITVGARWKAEFEWYAHARMAREFGVADDVIDAIAAGAEPPFTLDDEASVYRMTRMLLEHGNLTDEQWAETHAVVGDQGMVELLALTGYYCLICFVLNGVQAPLPPGETPQWGVN